MTVGPASLRLLRVLCLNQKYYLEQIQDPLCPAFYTDAELAKFEYSWVGIPAWMCCCLCPSLTCCVLTSALVRLIEFVLDQDLEIVLHGRCAQELPEAHHRA